MMKCEQRREKSLNEYIARFNTECLTVIKPENSIILLAFMLGLNDDRSDSRSFKEDDGWINIHSMDDVREEQRGSLAQKISDSSLLVLEEKGMRRKVIVITTTTTVTIKSHTLFVPQTIRIEGAGEKVLTKGKTTGMRPEDLHSKTLLNSHP